MQELSAIIEDLNNRSLYKFKCCYDEIFTLKVLYFSPDDYHTYVGFRIHNETIFCYVGAFYVNKKNNDLFFDNHNITLVIDSKILKKYFNIYKGLRVWNDNILYNLYPESETYEK